MSNLDNIKLLEKNLLGWIALRPEILEKTSLTEKDFRAEINQSIFREFKIQFELGMSIDLSLVCERISEDGIFSYLSSLSDGLPKSSSIENFELYVFELRKRQLRREFFGRYEKLAQAFLRTDDLNENELSDLSKTLDKIHSLETLPQLEIEIAPTIEELAYLQIPEIDWLVEPIIERFGFCLVGAQKGVGKSLWVTQLALSAAAGIPSFLIEDIKIARALNVLLIQQEVSLPGMKDRLLKMRKEKTFDLGGRFRQKTTTGAWWNLTKKEDYQKLLWLLDKYKPDILILDPLYTFYPKELNTSGDISPMMKILSDLKSNFNLGLVVVHHFSNKPDADEIQQKSSVGRFMGHSMIANSADSTVGLDFLHPKYRQQTLPLPYQNYVMIEITTRHGEWPARFAIERKHGCLLFEKSTIWQDLGRSIVPGRIEEILEANDGGMLQKDLIGLLIKEASPTTIRRGIDESLKRGSVIKQALSGKGNPIMLRIKK